MTDDAAEVAASGADDSERPAAPPAPPPDPFALPLVSVDDPCGPDLDLAGDADFLRFFAAIEGALPGREAKFFYEFKRDSIDFPGSFRDGERLLSRSLDIRVLVLLAKLAILNRDLPGFARWIRSLAWALRERWDGAHPRAEGGDYSARLAQLMTLEENTTVLLPLQYATLLDAQREGEFSYRAQLVATGAATPRSVVTYGLKGDKETSVPESFMPAKTIDRLLRDVEINKLAALFETLDGLLAALQSIKASTLEHVGFEKAVDFSKLEKLVRDMTEFARGALVARDPTRAPAPAAAPDAAGDGAGGASAAAPPTAFASRSEVDAALASALGYFAASEPTSPSLLLIRQARETLGKNLYEVMKLLAPPHADGARVFVGPDGVFTVPVKILSNAPGAEVVSAPAEPAPSRAAALALIDAVAAHMKRAEPSSPVPYLLERAQTLASRDFVSLLSDVLSEEAFANLKKGR